MFTKALILVLLGSTLILAYPRAEDAVAVPPNAEEGKSLSEKLAGWWSAAKDTAKDYLSSGKEKVDQALNEIKAKGGEWAKVSQETLEKLKAKGLEVAKSTSEAVDAEKEKWAQKIKEAKESEAVQTISYKVKQLEQQAAKAVSDKIKETQQTWEQWKQEAKEAAAIKKEEEKKKADAA